MLDTLKDFIKTLNKKEKIIIIASMSALAAVLICVVVLLAFCGAAKHTHLYQYRMERVDGKFNVIGKCFGEEGDCRKPEIVMSNVEVETETTPSTCTVQGTVVYTYVCEDGTKLTEMDYLDLTEHTLNGVVASTLANADGSYNKDIPGVALAANTNYVCEGTAKGYYNCEICAELVSIDIFKPHDVVEVTGVAATCTTGGTMINECKDCKAKLEGEKAIAALGHNYKYQLDIANSTLAYSCQREGCNVSATETVTGYTVTSTVSATCDVPARTVYKVTTATGTYENVVVDGKTLPHKLGGKDTENGSEHAYGTPGIKYFADSEIECGKTIRAYFNCEVCQGIVEVKVNKPDHNYTLDWSTLTKPDYKNAGSIHYKCNNADCKLFMNIILPAVLTSGEGKNATVTAAATELKGETAKYSYTEPIFNVIIEIDEVISSAKLEHNYTYALTDTTVQVGTEVKGTCSNAGCVKPEISGTVDQIISSTVAQATCVSPAGSEYRVILNNGEELTLRISGGTTLGDHQLNGQDASTFENSDGTYYDSVPGIKIFGGTKLNCDETASGYYTCTACKGVVQVTVKGEHSSYTVKDITVPTTETTGTATLYCAECKTSQAITLGKIVTTGEGKNADEVNETSAATIYDYTYVISADDKIVFRITVPKTAA